MKRKIFTFVLLAIVGFSSSVFTQILKLDGYNLPPDFDRTWDILVGDFNNDGFEDLFCINEATHCRLYLNETIDSDGDGFINFSESDSEIPDFGIDNRSGAVIDINNDKLLDILIGRSGRSGTGGLQNILLVNKGNALFSIDTLENWQQISTFSTQDIVLCDIDLDEDQDIITANGFVDCKANPHGQRRKERNCVYFNIGDTNGDGIDNYVDPDENVLTQNNVWDRADNSTNLAVGDIDGNGYPDLVFANFEEKNRLYLNYGDLDNDGFVNFIDATDSLLPDQKSTDNSRDVCLADFDGDEDLDLFVLNDRGRDRLFFYDSSVGHYIDVTEMVICLPSPLMKLNGKLMLTILTMMETLIFLSQQIRIGFS
jgi:hypothetical protein